MRIARVDANQPEIVRAVRRVGGEVLYTHTLGQGAPDIFVAIGGAWYAVEIKDGSKPPSKRQLTPDEQEWHEKFKVYAPVLVWESVDEVLRFAGREGE